jgi:hypothetical protein
MRNIIALARIRCHEPRGSCFYPGGSRAILVTLSRRPPTVSHPLLAAMLWSDMPRSHMTVILESIMYLQPEMVDALHGKRTRA